MSWSFESSAQEPPHKPSFVLWFSVFNVEVMFAFWTHVRFHVEYGVREHLVSSGDLAAAIWALNQHKQPHYYIVKPCY